MELFDGILLGFSVAITLSSLALCLLGVTLGTLIGVLPGIGPSATIAMLLPITLTLSPLSAMIMLAGIYYGAQYGGSITAILVNLPGEPSSAVTAIDGYKMAQKGRAGVALSISAIGSFVAGTIATLVLVIPLLMYVTDHTPFQSLNPLRPDHFARLVVRVYTAWLSNPGGKMKAKDL